MQAPRVLRLISLKTIFVMSRLVPAESTEIRMGLVRQSSEKAQNMANKTTAHLSNRWGGVSGSQPMVPFLAKTARGRRASSRTRNELLPNHSFSSLIYYSNAS
jgi:hypothetical protein